MAANIQAMERAAKGEKDATLDAGLTRQFKLRKILVPVDFSECSKKGLEYAIAFAREFKAELLLLHVVEPLLPCPELTAVDTASLQAESREYADKELRDLRLRVGDAAACETFLREGKASRTITETAREAAVDLIIISTHGHSGLSRIVLGSTTEQVVRRANCPVLVVREHERDFVTNATGPFGEPHRRFM